MMRGDVYTAGARGVYTGKPRPVVVIQDDRFDV
ncbi:MAG: type II toxin-antitoxin system PemK/MazF family toxin, partial [Chloroflexi bacterium]|nr:type II toxin-antitoxin system PemK/MazF family toxin [Chloroflexota bacterium]